MTTYKLSPSDLTFLWDECPRCFYLKVKGILPRPQTPFPGIFSKIDGAMKRYFADQPTSLISTDLPAGRIVASQVWVESLPITLEDHQDSLFLRGALDALLSFDDRSWAVTDFKTSEPKDEHVAFYARQLHAYAYALENPAPRKERYSPVVQLGLVYFDPDDLLPYPQNKVGFTGDFSWKEIPLDMSVFMGFLNQVLALLECERAPESSETCVFCKYRADALEKGCLP
jgi:hypothetical protein